VLQEQLAQQVLLALKVMMAAQEQPDHPVLKAD
jgi:hypothetical protein